MKSLILRSALLTAIILLPAWKMNGAQSRNSPSSDAAADAVQSTLTTISIPGPMRSFLRMAAISQQVSEDEVLPLLAHNVAVEGFTYDRKGRRPDPTEYLTLLKDYVKQARELVAIAGPRQVIRISSCDQAGPLLKALGYELASPCGPDTYLITGDSERAFLTDDSGFPLTALEQTLRGGEPFEYGFESFKVPVLFSQGDWKALDPNQKDDLLDALLSDAGVARLYWAMARIDQTTREDLRKSPGLKRLLPLAPALDFYGSQITIQSGRVVVPGGKPAEAAWTQLAGASPGSPGQFVLHLLTKDEGWLAAYFDGLSRVDSAQQAYVSQSQHLQNFYKALVGNNPAPGPARPVFRPDAGLLLLVSGLQLDANGKPQVPGGLAAWKQVLQDLQRRDHSKLVHQWSGRTSRWTSPEQLLESMFAFSRLNIDDGPLQAYLSISGIDRTRSSGTRLTPDTVRLLASNFRKFGDQYLTFSEFPLDNSSITNFIRAAEAIDEIHDRNLRSDSLGIFQANLGLWKILARQREIPQSNWDKSWQAVVKPFAGIRSSDQLYDAARTSTRELLQASAGNPNLSQAELIDLLAGPAQASPEGRQVRMDLANKIRTMMAAQRLVSLDTLFELGDSLERMAKGEAPSAAIVPLAAQLQQFQLPKPLFTRGERAEWSMGLYENQHLQSEMQANLTKLIKARPSADRLRTARGELVPFLRDTLVGLNYAYYEPPGAQMIYNNVLFVRSHDFSGASSMEENRSWKTPDLFGRGLSAGGGAHLVGSLSNLPYVLAQVEENFIVPNSVQSLIWEDLVPTLMAGAVLPRWWNVTTNELHAVTLYQRFGEELVKAAGTDTQLREKVMGIFSDRMLPARFEQIGQELSDGRSSAALAQLTPADTFCLAEAFRKQFPSVDPAGGEAEKELDQLAQRFPNEVSWERLSADFGVPHPALGSTDARSLVNMKPFPTYLGYSSRLLAESWESNNLYWARLADEKGYSPVMLNLLVPQLTYRMIENIAATYLDDWPALLRSLRATGEEFQQGKLASLPGAGTRAGL
ncbi:MAG TPA: hypothetical protein VFZ27_00035 [Terriglobia bacterium]|nr:hypothetical protein [Terriglobia bacterium]